jgi:hypothetical protein
MLQDHSGGPSDFVGLAHLAALGLANEPSHAAHRLLSTDDFDPAVEEPELDEGPEDGSFGDRS